MTNKLDDFLIGPQSDEFTDSGVQSASDFDEEFRKQYDEAMRKRCDQMARDKYDEKMRQKIDERRLPDISDIIDENQSDFDYGE